MTTFIRCPTRLAEGQINETAQNIYNVNGVNVTNANNRRRRRLGRRNGGGGGGGGWRLAVLSTRCRCFRDALYEF